MENRRDRERDRRKERKMKDENEEKRGMLRCWGEFVQERGNEIVNGKIEWFKQMTKKLYSSKEHTQTDTLLLRKQLQLYSHTIHTQRHKPQDTNHKPKEAIINASPNHGGNIIQILQEEG